MRTDDLIAAARECLGTPFRHQGRLVGVGLDCVGVVVHALQAVGIDVIDQRGYGDVPSNGLLESAIEQQPTLVRVTTIMPGDILLMRMLGQPTHVALFTGDTIIHAYDAIGKCCQHRLDARWASRVVRIYRVKETV